MKETELKFRLETGQNAKESKMISERIDEIQEVECYTDNYIEWIESKAEINTKAIEILKHFCMVISDCGVDPYLRETYNDANKLLKSLKIISL